MLKNANTIKRYFKLARINPFHNFFMFLSLLIPALLSILTPVLVSNAITAITVFNFEEAIKQISYEFLILIFSALSYLLYHFISKHILKTITTNLQEYIYANAKNNKNIKSINLSTLKNISFCASFNKTMLYKFCFLIKAIIILFIIFHYNQIIAIAILFVSIVTYLLLKISDRKIQYKNQRLSKNEQMSLDLFNSIRNGENIERNYNLEEALKDKYFSYVEENIKTTNSISFYYNINNNFISLILKSTVFVSTLYLISLIKSTTLTLQIYLILTPYLTSSAENLISFFDIFSDIGLVNNMLDEFESLKFREEPKAEREIELSSYNIYFYQVSATQTNSLKLKLFNAKINFKSAVAFVGNKDCGKRVVFNLLNKNIQPDGGSIFIDGKNISNIDSSLYKKIVISTSKNDYFFNISIYENLFLVCPNRNKIFQSIKQFGLKPLIDKLPNKLNTNFDDIFDNKLKFYLGILRCYLSDAKIINIYEFPEHLNSSDHNLLKHIFNILKKHCTTICYLHDLKIKSLFDQIFYINNFEVKSSE